MLKKTTMKQKMKQKINNVLIFTQSYKYLGASFAAASTDLFFVYLALRIFHLHYLIAVVMGFIFGTLINFLISNKYVFERKYPIFYTCLKHYFFSLSGLFVNILVVSVMVEFFNVDPFYSKVFALFVGFVFNFTTIKFLAFNDRRIIT